MAKMDPLDREVLEAADLERARLRQLLHDSVCQNLNALQIFLALHARRMASHENAEAANAEILKDQFQEAMTELHDIVGSLGPAIFEPMELSDELAALCRSISRRLPCQLSCDSALLLPTAAAHSLYEIVREALLLLTGMESTQQVEVGIHAQRSEIALTLRVRTLTAEPKLPSEESWPRRVLAARVEKAGGQLKFECAGEHSLSLSCSLPLLQD